MNLLEVVSMPANGIKALNFPDWFVEATAKVFHDKNTKDEFKPMGMLLTGNDQILMIFPDFRDEDFKKESMRQMRVLAQLAGGVAFGMVTEAWMKTGSTKDKETMNFIKNLSYRVSLLPDREEVLLCALEVKESDTVKSSLARWPILHKGGKRKLGELLLINSPTQLYGKMMNVLS